MSGSPSAVLLRGVRWPGEEAPVQVAVRDGRIAAVAEALGSDGAEVVDLEGRTVLPGLWDHHVHVTQWASLRARVDVRAATSPAQAAALVRAAVAAPGFRGDVLIGHGMRHLRWTEPADRHLLDAAAPGVAVVLQGGDLHTAWANTAALRRTGLAEHPTGMLREADCFQAVAALSEASAEQRDAWVADALDAAAARGVTGLRDFEFGDPTLDWQRRVAGTTLPVRVVANVYPEALDAALARGWRTGATVDGTGRLVSAGHLKLFVDGALNSRTALCHDPYPGSDDHGAVLREPQDLVELIATAWAHGVHPAVHAIGDRAVAIALDALDAVGCPGRIEHAQLVARADVPRLAQPGRVIGVQPAHAPDDRDVADEHWAGRTGRAFPLADLLAAGATLELGSDAPVSPLDPWQGIAAAVARTADDRPPWHPEQRIDARAALRASCGGRDRLAVDDAADLAVVDADPLRADAPGLRGMSVWGTMLAGRWTHRSD